MDRLSRPFFVCGLGLFLAAGGCRSTQPEVPPGRPYAKDGQPRQAIQFSSDGHPATAQGSAPYMPNNLGGSNIAAGIGTPGGRPDGGAYSGAPGAYGPIGNSGTANPSNNLSDPSAVRASSAEPASIPLTGTPPAGAPPSNLPPFNPSAGSSTTPGSATQPDLNVNRPRDPLPMPNQVIQTPMGTPDQPPSPN